MLCHVFILLPCFIASPGSVAEETVARRSARDARTLYLKFKLPDAGKLPTQVGEVEVLHKDIKSVRIARREKDGKHFR